MAQRGKSSTGWFYGFKLHKAINRRGELIAVRVTPGNKTVFDELRNLCQIEHSRHRSPINFAVNLMGGLVAYCLMPKKPTLPLQAVKALQIMSA